MRIASWMIAIVLALSSSVASRDKLSEFKDADRHDEGCVTIPVTYSSERSACDREGPNVHPWCDGEKGPVTCGSREETEKPKRDIETATRSISDLRDRKSRAESNRSSASTDDDRRQYEEEIKQTEKDLEDANKSLEAAQKALDARKKLVEDAIYTLDKCIAYRRAVRNSFSDALDKMRNERETEEIKNIAGSLVVKYEKQKRGHEIQITARENAYNNCREWRP